MVRILWFWWWGGEIDGQNNNTEVFTSNSVWTYYPPVIIEEQLKIKLFELPKLVEDNSKINKIGYDFIVQTPGYYTIRLDVVHTKGPIGNSYKSLTDAKSVIMYKIINPNDEEEKREAVKYESATLLTSLTDITGLTIQTLTWARMDLTDVANTRYRFYFGETLVLPTQFYYTLAFTQLAVFIDPEMRTYNKMNGDVTVFRGPDITYDDIIRESSFIYIVKVKRTYTISAKISSLPCAPKISNLNNLRLMGRLNGQPADVDLETIRPLLVKKRTNNAAQPNSQMIIWEEANLSNVERVMFLLNKEGLGVGKTFSYNLTFY